jgi:hypothetical protein
MLANCVGSSRGDGRIRRERTLSSKIPTADIRHESLVERSVQTEEPTRRVSAVASTDLLGENINTGIAVGADPELVGERLLNGSE